jgi:hypothetical protein
MSLTAAGLVLDIVGVLIVWKFGWPQPNFELGTGLAVEDGTPVGPNGETAREMDEQKERREMKYRRWSLVGIALITAGFALQLSSQIDTRRWRSAELFCSGTVNFGRDFFLDKFVIRVRGQEVVIRGEPGATMTFDGMGYSICSESESELSFQFGVPAGCSGATSTRRGLLEKVTGKLQLVRTDMEKPFVGRYECKSARRVID